MGFARISAVILILTPFVLILPEAAKAQGAPPDSAYFGKVIRSIRYRADGPLDRSRYDPYLPLKTGDTLTRSGVKEAIQILYNMGRFSQITVSAEFEDEGVNLQFNLLLNYYFNEFHLVGDVDLGGRSSWEVIPLPVGERFSQERLEDAREAVLKYLHDRGFFLAELQTQISRIESIRQVDTSFEVKAGKQATISSVSVHGVPPEEVSVILEKLGVEKGEIYARDRVRRRLEDLRKYFVDRGFLGASATISSEEFEREKNSVALGIDVANYGEVRVKVDGFKVPKPRLQRLLPILSVGGIDEDLLEEGKRNLVEHVEESGYPESDVTVKEETDEAGVRTIRYNIQAGRKVIVTEVRFRGSKAFTEDRLLAVIDIQPSRFLQKSVYSVRKLDDAVEALRSFYQAAGYLDATITPLPKPVKGLEKLQLTFEVEEGPRAQTRELRFAGVRGLSEQYLRGRIQLKQGGPYSPHLAEQARQALLAAYNDAGFLQPRVTYTVSEPDSAHSYFVEFQITEGPQTRIENILVLGNRHTRDSVIEKRIRFRENEPLSLGKILETQQALYNIGIFDRVRVSPQNPESTAPYQDVVVRVEEANRLITGYGLGYQETEGVRGTFELTHLNILGTGRRGDLRIRGSRLEQGMILSMQQPQFLPIQLDSYFTFSARKKREVSFDSKRINLSYQFGHPLNNHSWALLRYNFQNVRISNLQIVESPDFERDDTPRNLSTISAIYVNDTRDNYLDAETGFFTSTDLSVTTKLLGGKNNYVSLFTQNSYFKRLPRSLVLATSLRFGVAKPYGGDRDLPISEKFFAGGGSSLRGFETDRAGPLDPITNGPLGGNALFILNTELRLPLLRSVHLAGFFDTGNLFGNLSDLSLSGFSHTLGVGLRVKTPFGPIRVDYGFNLNLPARLRGLKDFNSRQLFVTIGPPF